MEYWDIYDSKRNLTGKVICRNDKSRLAEGEYHLVVDVWIINSQNKILIQKRVLSKKNFPGLWAQSAGGAAVCGEDSFQACLREVEEELGISPTQICPELIGSFTRHGDTLVDVYIIRQDIDIAKLCLQESEVAEIKWAGINDIKRLIAAQKFVPTVVDGLHAALRHNIVFCSNEETDWP